MHGVGQLREVIEKNIRQLELNKPPAELYEPISYTLNSKGKRIRPVLTLLACQMFSEKIEAAIMPALGFEVFHNFTLLHDDIMDKASVRRGLPTVHEKWNENTAILSGDAMMIEAYKLVCKAPGNHLTDVLNLFSETAVGVCEGQMYDMQFENREDVCEREYLEMIRLKTSVLLAACLKAGAIIGGAPNGNAELLYEFGINLGLAFQLKDDWLDVYGDPDVFGKKTGGDIVVNKKTYLLVKALEMADNETKKSLTRLIAQNEFDEDEKIKSVKAIYGKLGIGKLTQNMVAEYSNRAFERLAKVTAGPNRKNELVTLGRYLLDREK